MLIQESHAVAGKPRDNAFRLLFTLVTVQVLIVYNYINVNLNNPLAADQWHFFATR